MSRQDSSSGSVLMAFVLGALAGAAVALLYAPASGEDTRRRLADKARQGKDRAEGAVRDGRDFVQRHRDDLSTAVARGRDVFEQVRKETL